MQQPPRLVSISYYAKPPVVDKIAQQCQPASPKILFSCQTGSVKIKKPGKTSVLTGLLVYAQIDIIFLPNPRVLHLKELYLKAPASHRLSEKA